MFFTPQFNRCFTISTRAHILSVFFAGILGFSVGCILHALPMTASFIYIDVAALVLASVTAAVLTTVYVQKSFYSTLFSATRETSEEKSSEFHKQPKIGAEIESQNSTSVSSVPPSERIAIAFGDNSAVSRRITELLRLAQEKPNHFAQETVWSTKLLQTASDKWNNGSIILFLSNRQSFGERGLEDCWSISEYKDGVLQITAGFLDALEVESYMNRTHQALAYL
jgi:hypothetical protein